ncbi:DUF4209 domain-containing protein [Catenulispora subtropica]
MSVTHNWDESVIESFNAILHEQLDYYETATRMSAALGESPDERAASLIRALLYHPTPRPHLSDPGSRVYAPMIELADGQSRPERVGEATDATLEAWDEATQIFENFPLIVARLADLLWLRRYGTKNYLYAQKAQKSLRALSAYPNIPDIIRADYLVRALDLAHEAGMKKEIAPTVSDLVAAAKVSLQNPEWVPGVSLRLIERLARLPKRDRPADLDELVQAAVDAYGEDPFILEAILQIRLHLIGPEPELRRATALEIVNRWKKAADGAPTLIAQRHIEQALSIARSEGLSDEVPALRTRLQEISRQEHNFSVFSVDVNIPAERIEAFIAQFTNGDDPQRWLGRFASYCPVQQDRDLVARQVREKMQQAPFQYLTTKILVNAQGLPTKTIVGDEQHFAQAMIDHDTFYIVFWSNLAAEILDRMSATGRMTEQEISTFLSESVFDESQSEGIARSFMHYAAGRYEEAMLCCIPRLEAALRSASMAIGLVVYIEPGAAANQLGSFKGLGDLLRALAGRAPEPQRSYLQLMLAEPLSLNLRNKALHGLMQEVSKQDAALVLHAAAALGQWQGIPAQPAP